MLLLCAFALCCGSRNGLLVPRDELEGGSVCAGGFQRTFESSQHAVSVYLTVDRSGSMDKAKWDTTTNAIEQFVSDPRSAGMHVGLGFFPVLDEKDCPLEAYTLPAVGFGPLLAATGATDPQERALLDVLRLTEPQPLGQGGTPTFGALRGALIVARARANVVARDERVVVVFITDGQPTSCALVGTEVAEVAAVEFHREPPIRTYAVGLEGASQRHVDAIAERGGGEAFYAVEGDVGAKLVTALIGSQGRLSCTLTEGVSADPEMRTDVVLHGTATTPLERVANLGACGASLAFFVHVDEQGAKLELCPEACALANSIDTTSLDLRVGCS